ncbi:MAG: hypothetical protein JWM59_1370 [Verrucomicrobiales bacterium]|nr:hypothetical protein [Verrucomicrobiales bacterium]
MPALCAAAGLLSGSTVACAQDAADGWARALPGWRYEFPRDHFTHRDFKTEWWYATGRVRAASGKRFGYQFTIFRRGLRPPLEQAAVRSHWVVNDLPLGHFALTDEQGARFYYHQRLMRGAFGEAGFPLPGGGAGESPAAAATDPRLAWIGDWAIGLTEEGSFSVKASQPGAALDLRLMPRRQPVINGRDGVSQKSGGAGNASHYYSMPRLETTGTVTVEGRAEPVTGLSWLDREWATNQLAEGQIGWDWLSLHLSDGSDLMIYQLRGKDGKADEYSSGTLIGPDGAVEHLTHRDFSLTPVPGHQWRSVKSGGVYPILWQVELPAKNLKLEVRALLPDQELALSPVSYWEGAVDASGTCGTGKIEAEGYLEMTGYSGALKALRE